ncbi:CerR family C-terminal domain-containing protein [Tropicimonas sp.]|uniref:CerR family C-terminal domain-containing protein n=1 Tax=Tropicimonas sp. TaxID=2067044 RepID=UPI003A880812
MSAEPTPERTGTDTTRKALIDAAIELFGSKGFDGTTTRAIARAAGTNVASISYHFGGKEALRLACGEEISARLANVVRDTDTARIETPDQAAALLREVLSAFVRFIVSDGRAANMVAFVLRELSDDSPAFETIFTGVMVPRHAALCRLWEVATGQPAEDEQTRLILFSVIGQVLYFRIGQPVVLRRMEWDTLDPARIDRITAVLCSNLDAVITASRKPAP